MDAAKQANAFDFIQGFEEKFETLVGERGVRITVWGREWSEGDTGRSGVRVMEEGVG